MSKEGAVYMVNFRSLKHRLRILCQGPSPSSKDLKKNPPSRTRFINIMNVLGGKDGPEKYNLDLDRELTPEETLNRVKKIGRIIKNIKERTIPNMEKLEEYLRSRIQNFRIGYERNDPDRQEMKRLKKHLRPEFYKKAEGAFEERLNMQNVQYSLTFSDRNIPADNKPKEPKKLSFWQQRIVEIIREHSSKERPLSRREIYELARKEGLDVNFSATFKVYFSQVRKHEGFPFKIIEVKDQIPRGLTDRRPYELRYYTEDFQAEGETIQNLKTFSETTPVFQSTRLTDNINHRYNEQKTLQGVVSIFQEKIPEGQKKAYTLSEMCSIYAMDGKKVRAYLKVNKLGNIQIDEVDKHRKTIFPASTAVAICLLWKLGIIEEGNVIDPETFKRIIEQSEQLLSEKK